MRMQVNLKDGHQSSHVTPLRDGILSRCILLTDNGKEISHLVKGFSESLADSKKYIHL